MRAIYLDYSRYVQPPIASLIFAIYGKNLQTLKFAKKTAKTRIKIQAAYLCMRNRESLMKPLKPLVLLFLCLFWHKGIMPILAFSKVAKFC